jgi:hypothetical protein
MAMRRARADVMSLQRPASAGHVPLATDADARASVVVHFEFSGKCVKRATKGA